MRRKIHAALLELVAEKEKYPEPGLRFVVRFWSGKFLKQKSVRTKEAADDLVVMLRRRAATDPLCGIRFVEARFTDQPPELWSKQSDGPPIHRYLVRWRLGKTSQRAIRTLEEAKAYHQHLWNFERRKAGAVIYRNIIYRVS